MRIETDLVVLNSFFLGDKWAAKANFAQKLSRHVVVTPSKLGKCGNKYSRLPPMDNLAWECQRGFGGNETVSIAMPKELSISKIPEFPLVFSSSTIILENRSSFRQYCSLTASVSLRQSLDFITCIVFIFDALLTTKLSEKIVPWSVAQVL